MKLVNGTGLRYLNRRQRWYGGGYCGICGHRGESLIARAVRWWDPDDGWKMGVLCEGCTEDQRDRGPQTGDYAANPDPMRIDVTAAEDLDAAYSDQMP